MANNYTEVTMTPPVFLTERQEELLHCYGAGCEPSGSEGKLRYIYWESYFNEEPDEDDCDLDLEGTKLPPIHLFLREILQNPENKNIEALDVNGCYRCDKLRPGEFGGFSLLVTRKEYAYASNSLLRLRKGKIVPIQIEVARF